MENKPFLLVVDDEDGCRQALRAVFKNEYHVLMASDGTQAIGVARSNPVNVCVCDIMMPGLSGTAVLQELKQINPKIEVIMLTAFETIETARLALRHGACDYLNKPFDVAAMRTAVARAVVKNCHEEAGQQAEQSSAKAVSTIKIGENKSLVPRRDHERERGKIYAAERRG